MMLELFEKGTRNNTFVSINVFGQLIINVTCQKEFIKECKNVLLYADKDKKILGIKPIQEATINSFKLSPLGKNKKSSTISGCSILKYMGINFKKAHGRYPIKWDQNKEIIILELGNDS